MTGDLPGTLRYMSPEQALGKRALVDRRTDIYSLGATLYELLTLRPAVAGSDRQEIFRRIAEDEPTRSARLNPAVPVDLATIVAKALSKDPSSRYETAWQLADDLEPFLDGRPIARAAGGPLARTWRWCRRKPVQAALAAGLVLASSWRVRGDHLELAARPGAPRRRGPDASRQGRRDQPLPDRQAARPGRPENNPVAHA